MYRIEARAQTATFDYPRTPLFETGHVRTWQPSTVWETFSRTYPAHSTAQGQATRFRNAWADARTLSSCQPTSPDAHGFTVTVYRSENAWNCGRYSYVIVRTRVTEI